MDLEQILNELKTSLENINDVNELNNLKALFLGKKGSISLLSSKIVELPVEERKTFGAELNKLKNEATSLIEEKRTYLENKKSLHDGDSRTIEYSRCEKGFEMTGNEDSQMSNSEIFAVSKILLGEV